MSSISSATSAVAAPHVHSGGHKSGKSAAAKPAATTASAPAPASSKTLSVKA